MTIFYIMYFPPFTYLGLWGEEIHKSEGWSEGAYWFWVEDLIVLVWNALLWLYVDHSFLSCFQSGTLTEEYLQKLDEALQVSHHKHCYLLIFIGLNNLLLNNVRCIHSIYMFFMQH